MSKEKINTIFIYITSLGYCNVLVSQVLGWLKLFQKKGITFCIYHITSLKYIFRNKNKEDIIKIKKEYSRSVKINFAPPRFFLGRILNTFLLLFIVLKHLMSGKLVVMQVRALYYWTSFRTIKTLFPKKFIIIYDSRAAAAAELIYSNPDHRKDTKIIARIKETERGETMMVRLADKVFAVSNVLIDYHLSKDENLTREKFFLYPCCADASLFYFSEDRRSEIRQKLDLADRKVIVYSGGLEMAWQIPEKVFEAISMIIKIEPSFFFLVLTPDATLASDLAEKHVIPKKSIFINSVEITQINKFLCAADFAILLRDNVPVNNVASPTKFAEYIMTGLPVIISENVGDFSLFVDQNDIGKVISSDYSQQSMQRLTQFLILKLDEFKQRRQAIANLGYHYFSKDINVERIISVYKSFQI